MNIQKEKAILIPDDLLRNYLPADQLAAFKAGHTGIFSLTIYAEKPVSACGCAPGCCASNS